MDQSRILIIGANGQLGKALQAKYPAALGVDKDELDITNWKAISNYSWSKFDIIINAAAYTNVDGAETTEGRKLAWQINATAAGYLSKVATENNLTIIHISSDYVFDGSNSMHIEDEPFSPLGVYGQTKTAGDIAVSTCQKHYIIRTSWLIGDGPNFVRTIMELANKNISPTVVNDQIGRLTFTSTLVDAIDHIFANNFDFGTYNISNSGDSASWADITTEIFKILGKNELGVTGVSTEQYYQSKESVAPRPLQSTLDLSKIENTGFKPTGWQESLVKYIDMGVLTG